MKHAASFAEEYRKITQDPMLQRCIILMNNSGLTKTIISNRCGVSAQTLNNWQSGRVKRPQATTLRFVLRAMGYELTIRKA